VRAAIALRGQRPEIGVLVLCPYHEEHYALALIGKQAGRVCAQGAGG
jgi:hypothetical protein